MYLNTSTKQPLIVTLFLRHIHLWLSLQSKMKNLPLAHVTVTYSYYFEKKLLVLELLCGLPS